MRTLIITVAGFALLGVSLFTGRRIGMIPSMEIFVVWLRSRRSTCGSAWPARVTQCARI
jgi:hypothetical protein